MQSFHSKKKKKGSQDCFLDSGDTEEVYKQVGWVQGNISLKPKCLGGVRSNSVQSAPPASHYGSMFSSPTTGNSRRAAASTRLHPFPGLQAAFPPAVVRGAHAGRGRGDGEPVSFHSRVRSQAGPIADEHPLWGRRPPQHIPGQPRPPRPGDFANSVTQAAAGQPGERRGPLGPRS